MYRREFLQGIIFCGGFGDQIKLDESAEELLSEWNIDWIYYLKHTNKFERTLRGPYIYNETEGLCQVWRIYDDHLNAFVLSVWPSQYETGCKCLQKGATCKCSQDKPRYR